MDNPIPPLGEQGILALREGKLDEAIRALVRTVLTNGDDAEAAGWLAAVATSAWWLTALCRGLTHENTRPTAV